jgi:hypothetical protein
MQGYLSRVDNPTHPAWALLNFGYLVTAVDQPPPPPDLFKRIQDPEDAALYQSTNIRPRAWVAARAQIYDTADQVLDRIANSSTTDKLDFDPDQLVLLDKQFSPENADLIQADPTTWSHTGSTSNKPRVDFLEPSRTEEDRPEILRLRVSGNTGGYLVLADAYVPGWTATVTDDSGRSGKDVPVLPAYGVCRAVPLPTGMSTCRVEFRYRPWSWRIGALTSIMTLCLLSLLTAAAFFIPPRRLETKPETKNYPPQMHTDEHR